MQELLVKSRLFVEPEKLAKSKGKAPKGRQARQIIKVGQGGTLDPLADGVLGKFVSTDVHVICL